MELHLCLHYKSGQSDLLRQQVQTHASPRYLYKQTYREALAPNNTCVLDSDYQDPDSLACTGPPGTPSPIRDALYSPAEDERSSSNEIYDELEGNTGTMPAREKNV